MRFNGILALVSLLGLGITQSAEAYNVTLEQVGADVVATGSGAFNLMGLDFFASGVANGFGVSAINGTIVMGSGVNTGVDTYNGFTGPTSFGSGGDFFANTGSGDFVAIQGFLGGHLYVPHDYAGAALSDSITFNNSNFATMGLTPGTYVWSWGDGANQNFTLQIGSVPDGGSTVSLLGFASLGLVALRRKLRC